MATDVVGSLRVLLSANTAEFDRGLSQSEKSLNKFVGGIDKAIGGFKNLGGEGSALTASLEKITGSLSGVTSGIAALGPAGAAAAVGVVAVSAGFVAIAGAAVAAGAAIYSATTRAADLGDEFFTLSNKTGIAVEALSELKFVGQQADVPLEAITGSIFKLGQNLSEGGAKAKKGLDAIGLGFNDLRKLSPDKAFELVIKGLHDIPDAGRRAAAGIALFGKGFKEISQLTQEDMGALIEQANKLGLVMSSEFAVAGDRFNDAVGAIGAQIDAVQAKIGAEFLPVAITFVETFGENFTEALSAAGFKAGEFADLFEKVAVFIGGTLLPGLTLALSAATRALVTFFGGGGITSAFIVDALAGVIDQVNRVVTAMSYISPGLQPAVDALNKLSKTGHEAAANTVKDIGSIAAPILKTLDAVDIAATRTALTFPESLAKVRKEIKEAADAMRAAKGDASGFGGALAEGAAGADKAAAAANKLNEAQHKLAEEMRKAGIMTQEAIAVGLEPLIEDLNTAAQVSEQQLRATLQKQSGEWKKLAADTKAAGGEVQIVIGLWQQYADMAGLSTEAMIAFEHSLPIVPLQEVIGQMQAFVPAADYMVAQQTAINDAFTAFGLKSPQELEKVAKAAEHNYAIVAATAGVTKDQVKAAWDQMVAAQLAAQGKVPSAWEKDIFPRIKDVVGHVADAIQGSFSQMLLGAKGFKDGFLDIWESLKAGVMNILTQILADFTNRFLKGLLGALSGSQGAFGKAFAGLFGGGRGSPGLFGGIPGLGGLLGGGAAAVPVGVGVEAGIPIVGGAAGFGTPVAGGAAGTWAGGGGAGAAGGAGALTGILGGVGAAGAGFGIGALMQKFFDRGVKAASAGGLGGAATGALIGSIVPGIGTAIGAAIGGLAGVIGGIVNFGPSKKEREARAGVKTFQQDTFANLSDAQRTEAQGAGWVDPTAAGTLIAVRDAYLEMGKSAQDAERDVKAIWDAEKEGPEATAAAMQPVLAALEEYKKKHGEAAAATTAAVDAQKAKFTELKEHIQTQMADLDKELADINRSEAPEAHMGSVEKKARARIAQQQEDLKRQLAEAEKASQAAIDAITKAAAEGGVQIGIGFADGAKMGFEEVKTTGADAAAQVLEGWKQAGTDGADWTEHAYTNCWWRVGEGGLKVSDLVKDDLAGIPDVAADAARGIGGAFDNIQIDPILVPFEFDESKLHDGIPGNARMPNVEGHAKGGLFRTEHWAPIAEGGQAEIIGNQGFMTKAIAGALQSLGVQLGGSNTVNLSIQAMDGESVLRVVNSEPFGKALSRRLPFLFTDNIEGVLTNSQRSLGIKP